MRITRSIAMGLAFLLPQLAMAAEFDGRQAQRARDLLGRLAGPVGHRMRQQRGRSRHALGERPCLVATEVGQLRAGRSGVEASVDVGQ